jgi:hypothetical protein
MMGAKINVGNRGSAGFGLRQQLEQGQIHRHGCIRCGRSVACAGPGDCSEDPEEQFDFCEICQPAGFTGPFAGRKAMISHLAHRTIVYNSSTWLSEYFREPGQGVVRRDRGHDPRHTENPGRHGGAAGAKKQLRLPGGRK